MKIEFTLPGPRGLPPPAFVTEPAREPRGRAPRISRLVALAHKLDGLVRSGVVNDYAELARVGHISPARVSPGFTTELQLRKIAREPHWHRQRLLFERLLNN